MTKNQTGRTYLVGGAVRDSLLGLSASERDWVVVGSSIAEMKAAGFTQVGRDFPVFLHPQTREEYALARTERKTRPGHTGFVTDASAAVTLVEDLGRRDLTINAIAKDDDGNLIDPYHGCDDIKSRTIRHVSDAFDEDPLRILRVARFAARFSSLGFRIADETRLLCESMVGRGDLRELASERIFQETDKALAVDDPEIFFRFLATISADAHLWPEMDPAAIDLLAGTSQDATKLQRFAILFSLTPVDKIEICCRRLKTPRQYQVMATRCRKYLHAWTRVSDLSSAEIVDFLYQLDAIRNPDRFLAFSDTCRHIVDAGNNACHQQDQWAEYLSTISNITSTNVDANLSGQAVGKAIRSLQIDTLEAIGSHHEN
jgi:tRNA nucleotidyltransferase (CCA-adding enzyme)